MTIALPIHDPLADLTVSEDARQPTLFLGDGLPLMRARRAPLPRQGIDVPDVERGASTLLWSWPVGGQPGPRQMRARHLRKCSVADGRPRLVTHRNGRRAVAAGHLQVAVSWTTEVSA